MMASGTGDPKECVVNTRFPPRIQKWTFDLCKALVLGKTMGEPMENGRITAPPGSSHKGALMRVPENLWSGP